MDPCDTFLAELTNKIENTDILNELIRYKKMVDSISYSLESKIYTMCYHEWENDYIENPFTEELSKITYCKYCESTKQ